MLTPEECQALAALISSDHTSNTWKNFCETSQLSDVLCIKIDSVKTLQALLKKIHAFNQKKDPKGRITCRVAAGGYDQKYSESYSLTPIVEADIIFNLMFDDEKNMQLHKVGNQMHVSVTAGVQIQTLDTFLQKHNLRTQSPASLIGYVTAVGLAAVGGHGTDRRVGGYADNIESLTMVKMDGELVTIRRDHPDFETIASAHLGQFGIVTEMTLRCVPAEDLECKQTVMSLPDFLQALKKGELPDEAYPMFSVFYVPTYQNDANNTSITNVCVRQSKEVPAKTSDQNNEKYIVKETVEAVGASLVDAFNVPDNISQYPMLVEAYMQHVVAGSAIGESKTIVGPYANVYHYQQNFPHEINDVDGMFPVSDDYHEMYEAFTEVAKLLHEADGRDEAPVMYGVYARLIKNNQAQQSISPGVHASNKPYVCGFDIVSSRHATGFEAFRDAFVTFLIQKLDAKLHWGKHVPLDKGVDYKAMYGDRLVRFQQVLARWHGNDLARSPFLTPFFCDVLQLSQYKPVERQVARPASPTTTCCGLFSRAPAPLPRPSATKAKERCCAVM